MEFHWYDLVGSLGVGIIILTYFLLQSQKLESENPVYSILNALGAGMIAFSLLFNFNFAAFIVEFFWILISLYGLGKYFLTQRRNPVA